MSDAPEWKILNTCDREPNNIAPTAEQTTIQQTNNPQTNFGPVFSPNPITPLSNTVCSPQSAEENTTARKKSGPVAVSFIILSFNREKR